MGDVVEFETTAYRLARLYNLIVVADSEVIRDPSPDTLRKAMAAWTAYLNLAYRLDPAQAQRRLNEARDYLMAVVATIHNPNPPPAAS